jgi:ABC-2 type transport system permease protein
MSDLALAVRQVRYENKAFWRNPPAAFFTFAFPLMFLVIFNLVFGNERYTILGKTTHLSTFYIPSIAAFSIVTACYTNVALSVSYARDAGVLKRARGTPMPAWIFLFGRIAHSAMVALLLVIIVSLAGVIFFDVDLPGRTLPAFIASLLIGAASFCALGFAISAVIPNADAAPAIVNASILPLLFVSGYFFPTEDAPGWLRAVADVFPLSHFLETMLASFNPFASGSGLRPGHLAVVAAWGAAGALLAARFFSWEPRR